MARTSGIAVAIAALKRLDLLLVREFLSASRLE
jgi:hypothetical protein